MKHIIILFFTILFLFTIQSCKKECEINNPVCLETPPTDEVCQAYFERWFYNKGSDKCEMIGYSGCSQKGFESQGECENCGCE